MILVARLDFATNRITGLSIPRDTTFRLPDFDGKTHKINAYYNLAPKGEEKATMVRAIEHILPGVKIDRTIAINYDAFQNLVNTVGGVPVVVPKGKEGDGLHYDDWSGNLHINLAPGPQVLSGTDAMGYVRFRNDAESDYGRQERQKEFLTSFKSTVLRHPFQLPEVAEQGKAVLDNALNDREIIGLIAFSREGALDQHQTRNASHLRERQRTSHRREQARRRAPRVWPHPHVGGGAMSDATGPYDPNAVEGEKPVGHQYVSVKDLRVWGIGLLVLSVPMYFVYKVLEGNSERHRCITNMSGVFSAINLYAEQHDNRFPPLARTQPDGVTPQLSENGEAYTWISDVQPFLTKRASFVCPTATAPEAVPNEGEGGKTLPSTYGMYAPYAGILTSLVEAPDQIILVAETSNHGAKATYDPVPFGARHPRRLCHRLVEFEREARREDEHGHPPRLPRRGEGDHRRLPAMAATCKPSGRTAR